ncbi:hypothetical protein A3K73_00405 [Candidatus Pacearchaeota archaeon RBG_13_36_9]|nr:MAG: hypothetical protein A3K73_00405 [Candidatus Pacearchaeota archaeon RBG_13_36_9]
MKKENIIKKKIAEAEKSILGLIDSGDLKNLNENEKYKISEFYEEKSKNRLESAKLIYNASRESGKFGLHKGYRDYSEVVSAAYYSMYYIVHAFIALAYKRKLREGLRGVHAITEHLILYYMVKTGKLAKHLYENYLETLKITAEVQNISIKYFEEKAYDYAKKYDETRTNREIFTYNVTESAEEYRAKQAIDTAEDFINTVRQLMI